ncbi:hypothetical protein DPX16_17794 [Anabarilius grahami]|uniref:Uncharacterized protein n=1 Tax=Anabarilius grahami TaxID=495550 RepID=A0A3N0YIR2_ANAGA|nr:hypothetical protein DPX16_17794 [Anabarilius grahami]
MPVSGGSHQLTHMYQSLGASRLHTPVPSQSATLSASLDTAMKAVQKPSPDSSEAVPLSFPVLESPELSNFPVSSAITTEDVPESTQALESSELPTLPVSPVMATEAIPAWPVTATDAIPAYPVPATDSISGFIFEY